MPSVGVPRADLDALMRVVGSFAQFRELDALRQHTVAVLTTLMPSNAVGWNEVETERGRIVAVMEPDLYTEEAAATFMEHIGDQHRLRTGARRQRHTQADRTEARGRANTREVATAGNGPPGAREPGTGSHTNRVYEIGGHVGQEFATPGTADLSTTVPALGP